ncbi:MAG TPA: fructosamine kinase family protein [Tepidisphaeraceae bacterium]|nr:fructosamine kinase family protein [Tepidisphaeraceae bacterium]
MSIGAGDISWHLLGDIVRDWAGNDAELVECKPLAGGYIHITLRLTLRDGSLAVLKISPHRVDRGYLDEAHQLELLRKRGLPVPRVYLTQIASLDRPDSYILLEYIPGVDLTEARRQCPADEFDRLQQELADWVAQIHECAADSYQRVVVSHNEQSYDDWPTFFREVYDPIWHETEKHAHLPVKIRKKIGKIHDRLDRALAHDDGPRLTHWDLWSNNLLARPDADDHWHIAAFLDPNSKYAHAEAEIAYLELFHTVTPTFMKSYQKHRKLSPEYHRVRKFIYQMYPLIDHVNLFGEEYVPPLCQTVERLAASI